jgi:hypothetical protein
VRLASWLLIACACGSEPPPPAPAISEPPVDDVCAIAARVLASPTCKRRGGEIDEESADRTKQQLDALLGATERGGFAAPKLQTACARMLVVLERDRDKLECTLALTAEERALVRDRAGSAQSSTEPM